MNEIEYQLFPTAGMLAGKLNWDLEALRDKIGSEQTMAYCYIIATIKNRNDSFLQTGSAPNFQGDLITLCTCKHYMRTFLDVCDWKGKWIAGFTGVNAGDGYNILVYLMKVDHAFQSHHGFWVSEFVAMKTKQAKAAHFGRFGDIYQPMDALGDRFDYRSYVPPLENHVHFEDNVWHKDIDYEGRKGRKAALLVGDAEYSFLWQRPMIRYDGRLYRGQKKFELDVLLDHFE